MLLFETVAELARVWTSKVLATSATKNSLISNRRPIFARLGRSVQNSILPVDLDSLIAAERTLRALDLVLPASFLAKGPESSHSYPTNRAV